MRPRVDGTRFRRGAARVESCASRELRWEAGDDDGLCSLPRTPCWSAPMKMQLARAGSQVLTVGFAAVSRRDANAGGSGPIRPLAFPELWVPWGPRSSGPTDPCRLRSRGRRCLTLAPKDPDGQEQSFWRKVRSFSAASSPADTSSRGPIAPPCRLSPPPVSFSSPTYQTLDPSTHDTCEDTASSSRSPSSPPTPSFRFSSTTHHPKSAPQPTLQPIPTQPIPTQPGPTQPRSR